MIFKALYALALIPALAMAQLVLAGNGLQLPIDMTTYEGKVIRGSNIPAEYLVLDGELRYISAYTKAHCFNNDSVTIIEQAIVDAMPVGNDLPAAGELVMGNGAVGNDLPVARELVIGNGDVGNSAGGIYFPDNCTTGDVYTVCWRLVTNPDAFNKYHLNWDTIVNVPQVLIDSAPHGGNINP